MFNTFTDVFNDDENNRIKMNGTNPFDLPSSTTDPFGISSTMKISESSEKFDDNSFIINTNNDKSIRPRSGKEALSSPNWLAYQHSMDEANLDSVEDLQDTSLITQSNNVNLNNPFLISTIPSANQSKEITSQNFPTDLLFDADIDSNTVPPIISVNPFANPDQNSSPYDLFGLNQTTASLTLLTKVIESDSKTDMLKTNQNKISSSSLTNTSSIPEVASSHSLPTNVAPLVSSNISGTQATTLPIMTGTTSNSAHDDEFLDWLTQSDNLMSSVAPKQNEPSKKKDIYSNKSNEDLFGSIYRQPQTLATVRMYYKFFYFFFLLIQFLIQKKILKKMFHHHPLFFLKNQ
jgi:hypothetical protein